MSSDPNENVDPSEDTGQGTNVDPSEGDVDPSEGTSSSRGGVDPSEGTSSTRGGVDPSEGTMNASSREGGQGGQGGGRPDQAGKGINPVQHSE